MPAQPLHRAARQQHRAARLDDQDVLERRVREEEVRGGGQRERRDALALAHLHHRGARLARMDAPRRRADRFLRRDARDALAGHAQVEDAASLGRHEPDVHHAATVTHDRVHRAEARRVRRRNQRDSERDTAHRYAC